MSDNQRAIDNAKAWFESIREMVAAFNEASEKAAAAWRKAMDKTATSPAHDADRTEMEMSDRIIESPLSIQVRSGWHDAGETSFRPAEYKILLTIGGPALRIIGELSEHAEPTSAVLQWQDWGTPWADAMPDLPRTASEADAILLSYASHFYFGE